MPLIRGLVRQLALDAKDQLTALNREWTPLLKGTVEAVNRRMGFTRSVTANYTAVQDDQVVLADATSGAITVTLPDAATSRMRITVKKIDSSANAVTVAPATGDTLYGGNISLGDDGDAADVAPSGSTWYQLSGNETVNHPFVGQEILFEWNGTDVSQFESTTAFDSSGWAGALTYVADTSLPLGGKLRFGSAAGTGVGASVILCKTPLVFSGTKRRIVFEYLALSIDQSYGGIALMADTSDTGLHCFNSVDGSTAGAGTSWQSRIDNGTLVTAGGTIGGPLLGTSADSESFIRLMCDFNKPASAAPVGMVPGHALRASNSSSKSWEIGAPGWSAIPASWNGANVVCKEWGLCIQAAGAIAAPTAFDIGHIRILGYDA